MLGKGCSFEQPFFVSKKQNYRMKEESIMNRSYLIFVAFFLVFVVLAVNTLAAEKSPAEIVLRSTVNPAQKTKLAFFPHAVHQANFECAICHHGKVQLMQYFT